MCLKKRLWLFIQLDFMIYSTSSRKSTVYHPWSLLYINWLTWNDFSLTAVGPSWCQTYGELCNTFSTGCNDAAQRCDCQPGYVNANDGRCIQGMDSFLNRTPTSKIIHCFSFWQGLLLYDIIKLIYNEIVLNQLYKVWQVLTFFRVSIDCRQNLTNSKNLSSLCRPKHALAMHKVYINCNISTKIVIAIVHYSQQSVASRCRNL